MQVKIVFFGGLRYQAGCREHCLSVAGAQTLAASALLELVAAQFPALAQNLGKVALSVGPEIVGRDYLVQDGDEVCLLPPVSGGSGAHRPSEAHLSEAPLDLLALLAQTDDAHCGGLVVFSGDIRDHNLGRRVVAITYEAHEPIAAGVLAAIEQEVLTRFATRRCRIQHRIGRVEVGQSSVLVVVRAAHRAAAFEGARYAIDELKERTPIWKQEHYEEGDSQFLDGVPMREGPKP
ncbi:MAG: molybdenum cofactor biosynthesis protein MoaE [Bradymonadaceae bacterium]|nr:molybdenum cofactor biosynthesis protein MoaE [Lujinxingiaceae bacterium]